MMYDATLRKVKAEEDAIKAEGYTMNDCHISLRAGVNMPGGLMSEANEHFLLSGTKPQPSLRINRYRHTGMPPRDDERNWQNWQHFTKFYKF